MKLIFLIISLLTISLGEEIVDPHDNIPSEFKFGIAQEHAHPMCSKRSHAKGFVPPIRTDGEYDFIVVGGGSAGNVMAARLADSSPDIKVLLLESGKNPIDDQAAMDQSMKEIFKVDYCVPGQTADKCSLLSLPIHFAETPFLTPYLSATNHSYYFQTTPQIYGNKREITYPRGNMLGGSSATNNMIAFRGHPEDYDHWASLGLEGWSYRDLLPFMKKIETNHQYGDHEAHGKTGPIHLYNSSGFFDFPVVDNLIKTAMDMGYKKVEDFNKGYDYYGVGYWQQYSNEKGRRTSSYEYIRRLIKGNRVCIDGFIPESEDEGLKAPENTNDKTKGTRRPCTDQQNLHVKTETVATKLLFDESTRHEGLKAGSTQKPRVIGVEYTDHSNHPYLAGRPIRNQEKYTSEEQKTRAGIQYWKDDNRADVLNCPVPENLAFNNERKNEWYIPPFNGAPKADLKQVFAKREVILSAGAFNSPQLLMLSGIGPRKHLEHQLNFNKDELVMDLPGVGRLIDHEEVAMNFKLPSGVQHWGIMKDLLSETYKWVEGEPSALSSNHGPAGMDISSEGINGTKPTIHIHFLMIYFENLDLSAWRNLDATHRFPAGLTDFAFYKGLSHWTALIERSGTCSEGTVRLRSRDPFVPPFVDPNWGSCAFTNQEILFGIREMRRLNSLLPKEFQSEEIHPGKDYQTDDEIINWIRSAVWGHHPSGTAALGPCDDVNAVLDSHGRVFGVEGIRVADASAFPSIPHGNILYSTYTVAERIVDFMIKDHHLTSSVPSLLELTSY